LKAGKKRIKSLLFFFKVDYKKLNKIALTKKELIQAIIIYKLEIKFQIRRKRMINKYKILDIERERDLYKTRIFSNKSGSKLEMF
jgi:hypothetical protein